MKFSSIYAVTLKTIPDDSELFIFGVVERRDERAQEATIRTRADKLLLVKASTEQLHLMPLGLTVRVTRDLILRETT